MFTSFFVALNALIELIPIIKALLGLFIKTPEEKRRAFIMDLHGAIKSAQETGDTSAIEKLISGR